MDIIQAIVKWFVLAVITVLFFILGFGIISIAFKDPADLERTLYELRSNR